MCTGKYNYGILYIGRNEIMSQITDRHDIGLRPSKSAFYPLEFFKENNLGFHEVGKKQRGTPGRPGDPLFSIVYGFRHEGSLRISRTIIPLPLRQ